MLILEVGLFGSLAFTLKADKQVNSLAAYSNLYLDDLSKLFHNTKALDHLKYEMWYAGG